MIGHSAQREALAGLPFQATLLTGPLGVGKWLAAQEAAEGVGVSFEVREDPSADRVREVLGWLQMRPLSGLKVGLFDLDAMGLVGHHAMLKTLEEPPEHARLVCVASRTVLPTIWSRCHVVRFSALSREEVAEVLVSLGKVTSLAQEMALVSGSVAEALTAEEMLASRLDVLAYISAVERRDHAVVWDLDELWTGEHTRLLWRWVLEAATDNPKVFRGSDLASARALGRMFSGLARAVRDPGRFYPAAVALGLWRL